jgi:16S rRNA A1518/A1519 N6-dimethyltransferase RsmA/KsgA/DIM1 with predicted DNA glycosylase/AP lyase activity
MSAVLKPNELAALEAKLAHRRADVAIIEKDKEGREELIDELGCNLDVFLDDIIKAYVAGDDCQIGQIIGNCIGTVATRIYAAQLTNKLQDVLLPSWTSRMADAVGKPERGEI